MENHQPAQDGVPRWAERDRSLGGYSSKRGGLCPIIAPTSMSTNDYGNPDLTSAQSNGTITWMVILRSSLDDQMISIDLCKGITSLAHDVLDLSDSPQQSLSLPAPCFHFSLYRYVVTLLTSPSCLFSCMISLTIYLIITAATSMYRQELLFSNVP